MYWPNSFCQALPRVVCPREGSRRGGGPWQSSGASTVTPSLRRVRAGALCDMLFKVQQPKRPGKDSRVGLEVSTRS